MTMMATPQFTRMSDPSTSALLKEEDYFLPDDDDDADSLQHHDANYGVVVAVDETLPYVPSSSMTLNSSTSSSRSMPALDTIAEQQPPLSSSTVVSHSDAAAAILEEFFFGGQSELLSLFRNGLPDDKESVRPSKQQQQQPSEAGSEHGSPRSTIIPAGCSCSSAHIFSANNNSTTATTKLGERRQASMPAMSSLSSSSGSLKQPKRPSLKRRNSSVMVGVSTCSSNTSSSNTSSSNTSSTSADNNSIHDNLSMSLTNSKRNVSFTDISVREYVVELSDHPSCSYGPPIQLGWDYEEKEPTTVEDYEVTRSPHRRQNVHDLVLSYNARKHRLKHCSKQKYDKRDIAAVEKEIDKVKRERMMTEFFLPAMALDETMEQVCGYVKQVFQRPAAPAAVSHRGRCKIHS